MILQPGQMLSHYRLAEKIGEGGMGVVYRARDEHLDRDVAIKVLPAGTLGDDAARQRFHKEALALSKLNHPNIGTVHDFDTQDGVDFLVLELVHGRTLSERIAAGPLREEEVARLGEQLAEGLEAAHREAIIHRDIKPANLRITSEGRLKILDFGLARLVGPVGELSTTETAERGVVGTLPYMSPEQLRNQPVDARSDIYAAGTVLYEMACGRRAFPQDTSPAVIGAILGEPPTAPRHLSPHLSVDLERIILRCLEKDPAHRYQKARDLAADLRQLAVPAPKRRPAKPTSSRRFRLAVTLVGAAALIAAALLVAVNLGGLRDRMFGGGAVATQSLAVLPLANLSGDPGQDYFADGMTEELITRLAQVGALRVISRSSVMQYKGTKKPLRQIARELHVGLVVEGSVTRSDDTVRITAQLVDALTDHHLWAESYERDLSNVLALQSDVARAIVGNVRVRTTPEERSQLAAAPIVNPEAHKAYLKGRAHYNEYSGDGFQNALEQFRRAIEIDPAYAPAYAGLADTYMTMGGVWLSTEEAMPRARAAAQKALELDPQLAAAHVSLADVKYGYERDYEAAETGFKRALELNPGEVTVHQEYSALLVALGRFAEAEKEIARAREIDPLSPLVSSISLFPLFEGRQYDRAIAAAARLITADPTVSNLHMILGQALLFNGDRAGAIRELQRATELDPANPFHLGWLGYAYGVSGQRADGLATLDRLTEMQKKAYVQPYSFALIWVGLGENQKALDRLEKAFEERSTELIFLKVDPAMDPLRSEPRFQAILKKMNFPD